MSELAILKKKISSYRTPKGRVTNLPEELLAEILHEWEQWTGSNSGFYTAIGINNKKMATVIGRAKKLKREGHFDGMGFAEVEVVGSGSEQVSLINSGAIELVWDGKRVIRFPMLSQLIEFLKVSDGQLKQVTKVMEETSIDDLEEAEDLAA